MSKKQLSLHTRIEQEAIEYANQFKYGVEYRKTAYVDGAASYIAKLQAAEEKAARYEKALIKIVSLSCKVDSRDAILELKSIASMAVAKEQEALTPKTGEDE